MAACFEDSLLDFASDVGEEDEDEEHNKKSSSSSLNPNHCFPVSFFSLSSMDFMLFFNKYMLRYVFLTGLKETEFGANSVESVLFGRFFWLGRTRAIFPSQD